MDSPSISSSEVEPLSMSQSPMASPTSPTSLASPTNSDVDSEVEATGTFEEALRHIGPNKTIVLVPPGTKVVWALRSILTPEYYQRMYEGTEVEKNCSIKDGSKAEHFPPYERKLENNPNCKDSFSFSRKGLCWLVTEGKKLLGYKLADVEQCLAAINPEYRDELQSMYSQGELS